MNRGQGHRSAKQLRQLEYARQMKGVRARARKARGGTGKIALRNAARRLRAKFGYTGTTRRRTRGTTRRTGNTKARARRVRARAR